MFIQPSVALSREAIDHQASLPAVVFHYARLEQKIRAALIAAFGVLVVLAAVGFLHQPRIVSHTGSAETSPAVAAFEIARQVEACGEARVAAGRRSERFPDTRTLNGGSLATVAVERPECGSIAISIPVHGLDEAARAQARSVALLFQSLVEGMTSASDPAPIAAALHEAALAAGLTYRVTAVSMSGDEARVGG